MSGFHERLSVRFNDLPESKNKDEKEQGSWINMLPSWRKKKGSSTYISYAPSWQSLDKNRKKNAHNILICMSFSLWNNMGGKKIEQMYAHNVLSKGMIELPVERLLLISVDLEEGYKWVLIILYNWVHPEDRLILFATLEIF